MKKRNWINLIIVVSALIFICLGFIVGYFSAKTNKCEANPLNYGISKLEKMNDANFSCSCVSLDKNLKPFYFDDEEITETPPILEIINKSF